MSSTGSSTSWRLPEGFSRLRPFDSDDDSDLEFREHSSQPKKVYTAADITYIDDSSDDDDDCEVVCTHSDVSPTHVDSRESTPAPSSPGYSYAQPYDRYPDSDSDSDDQSHVSLDLSTLEPVEPKDDSLLDLKRVHKKQLAVKDKKIKKLSSTIRQLQKIIALYETPKQKRRCVGKKSRRA